MRAELRPAGRLHSSEDRVRPVGRLRAASEPTPLICLVLPSASHLTARRYDTLHRRTSVGDTRSPN